jgi:hypothetical protein
MKQNLINQYNIRLQNKTLRWEGFAENKTIRIIETCHPFLTDFLNDYSAEDLTDDIIPETEKVMNGTCEEFETGSATVSVSVFIGKVDFYDHSMNFVGHIPVQDFKDICEGWRDFLIS